MVCVLLRLMISLMVFASTISSSPAKMSSCMILIKRRHLLYAVTAAVFFLSEVSMAHALELKSSAFTEGAAIPPKFTCDGADLSPPLSWGSAPAKTKSFALIADDPDAPMGIWVHWVIWNIPASSTSLKEGMEKRPSLPDGTRQGMSDFKKPGFGGPCPPSGKHRYFFKLYALDTLLDLPAETTKPKPESAMTGHILAEARLMGIYARER